MPPKKGTKRPAETQPAAEDKDVPKGKKSKVAAAAPSIPPTTASGKVIRTVDRMCNLPGAEIYEDYDCMLNQTNIGNNNNKFYVIQMLVAGKKHYVWNRWGRVGEPGQNALKGPFDLDAATKEFEKKFTDKTSNKWEDRGSFVTKSGKYTLIKIKEKIEAPAPAAAPAAKGKGAKGAKAAALPKSKLHVSIQELIRLIFKEATTSLTDSIDAMITDEGIETALGVLSLETVEAGEKVLEEAEKVHNSKKGNKATLLRDLSSQYYTLIPHKFGRNVPPVLNQDVMFTKEHELIELMKDMINVTKTAKNVLKDVENLDSQYESLGSDITFVTPSSKEHKTVVDRIKESVDSSHKDHSKVKVKNIFKVQRSNELKRFTKKVKTNHTLLFHGSRINNWVGLLSRGILPPKVVVSEMGVARTDAGWLGSGVYFGNADTAAGYAGASRTTGSKFMLACTVALGKAKVFEKITYGLSDAGKGFDSAHGKAGTQFYDDEFVVYNESQYKTEYLIELAK